MEKENQLLNNSPMKEISRMIYSMAMVNILVKNILIKEHFYKGKKVEKEQKIISQKKQNIKVILVRIKRMEKDNKNILMVLYIQVILKMVKDMEKEKCFQMELLIDGNNKYIGYLENNMKNGYGASFYNSQNAILGFWQNDLIEGYAILILINNNPEKNKKIIQISSEENDNSSEESKSDFKYIKTLKGEIIKGNLEQDELNEFKLSKEYDDMIQLYNDKILPDFEQNLEESKSEENQSSSFFGNF